MSDIPEGASVLTGTFSINHSPIKILFDSGATHSCISGKLVGRLGLIDSHTKSAYTIVTSGGKISSHTLTYGVPMKLGSKIDQTKPHCHSFRGHRCYLGCELDDLT
jgi:hypothetical protein